ncbi:MAG: hypothetical protein Q8M09_08085 [Pseudomonadota bacterium]|nr:hypothetical protein [Pseudomonadota bacterium]MDP1904187.1 hypothetical protein [Pseudomonadota bacterium]
MTGTEFEAGMRRLGLSQAALARTLGVHRNTIAERCKADEVDPLFRAAMIGLLAEEAAALLVDAVGQADSDTAKKSK